MKEPKFDFYDKTSLKSYNLDESMQYQLKILDSLDAFTKVHSENVANLTCRICEYLHLPKAFTIYTTICAYIHDIGKQFIPPAVLQKNGSLTADEYEIMKTHTTIGYEICMRDTKLREYIAGPYYHHEALDGTGYPQGLKKEDIPYEGQIIRVADEFDAISSRRQYKSHVGICDTIKILIQNSNPTIKGEKYGKNNKKVLKCLIKVILDDTSIEIYAYQLHLENIQSNLKRLKQILAYKNEYLKAKNEKSKSYYLNGVTMLLKENENIDNIEIVNQDYLNASTKTQDKLNLLNAEYKNIKKLKV